MASIRSFPCFTDAKTESSVFRPRIHFLASFCCSGLSELKCGNLKDLGKNVTGVSLCCERFVYNRGFCRRNKGLMDPLKVISKESVEGEESDESDDVFEATIERSKKLLAMQRDLLQQIAERRKLVSSIRNSEIDLQDNELSSTGNDSSSTGNDSSSTTLTSNDIDSANNNSSSDVLSTSYVYSTTKEVPETQNLSTQFKQSTTKKVRLDDLPSFIPSSTKVLSTKDEKCDELKDITPNALNGEAAGSTPKDENSPPLAGPNVMNIILVAAECAPWSKTGGLGDVAGALPKALAKRGHRVMVVAPRYGNYAEPKETGVRKHYKVDGQDFEVSYFHIYIDGVDFVFMDSCMFRHMENNIYGGNRMDILKRMVLFCKAAVEVPWYVPCGGVCYGDGNLVFVANDWHTALLPVYLKVYYRDNQLMTFARSILVIHNIAHQGRGPIDDFKYVDLPQQYIDLFKMHDPIGGEHFNIFAAGLKTADRIVTVSHGYARELKTSEGGWGLHNIINENDWKLKGIVNGIDTKDWSPQSDIHLTSDGYVNYNLETLKTGKPQCKSALQKELGLPIRDDVPLIGFIGRLDNQKGVDLIAKAIPWMIRQDTQLVMLGSGRDDLEQMLRHLESQHRDRIRGWVGFSVKVAHRITAGADILLMPSRFEPCGLNQLYAMNYGTIPIVHAVGGLRDTVQPFDPYSESGLGWTFDKAEANRLVNALGNCLFTYRDFKNSWEGIQRRGMVQDLSWDNAAQIYEEVLVAAKYQW